MEVWVLSRSGVMDQPLVAFLIGLSDVGISLVGFYLSACRVQRPFRSPTRCFRMPGCQFPDVSHV